MLMADSPVKDEPSAQERFNLGIINALKMPPEPHVKKSASKMVNKKTKGDASAN